MPELAEVLFFSRGWDAALGGKVSEVRVRENARVFRGREAAERIGEALPGRVYRGARTHGKNLLLAFEPGVWLWAHLGMTGELTRLPDGEVPGRHDHLAIAVGGAWFVFRDPRMFGFLRLLESSGLPEEWRALPPEVLSKDFTTDRLALLAKNHARLTSKGFLLLQDGFPGIGNWMADEILWRCCIPPWQPVGAWDAATIRRVRTEARRLCRQAVAVIGKDWSDPPASWLFLHRWEADGVCPRCGGKLYREPVAGRTTSWCPVCQPGAGAASGARVGKGRRRDRPHGAGRD
jgi:formamidopyrimidine-DNA glycosylase